MLGTPDFFGWKKRARVASIPYPLSPIRRRRRRLRHQPFESSPRDLEVRGQLEGSLVLTPGLIGCAEPNVDNR